jgi:hypothetical protein
MRIQIPESIGPSYVREQDPNPNRDLAVGLQAAGAAVAVTNAIGEANANERLAGHANDINGNFRGQYVAKINDGFDKLSHKVNTLEAGYIASDIQRKQLSAAQKYTEAGDYEGALRSIATARNMGVLDDSGASSAVQATRKSFSDRLKYINGQMSNKLGAAAASGNRPAMDDFASQINLQLDDAVAKGIITPEERNEYASENKLDAEFQFARGQLLRTYGGSGIDAANKQLLDFSAQIPEGVDPEKWDAKICVLI